MSFKERGVKTQMIYGYARVSSKEQSLERQIQELKKFGVDEKNIKKEKMSAKNFSDRKVYNNLVKQCKAGDTIVFSSLDRFSRSISETVKQIEELKKKKVNAYFIKEQIGTETKGVAGLLLSVFSWVAEQERELLLERQRQGYQALSRDEKGRLVSNKTGKPLGRQELTLDNRQLKLLEDYRNGKINITKTELAKLLGISRSVLYKKVLAK